MSKPSPSLAVEGEALKEAYAALDRNDFPAMAQVFDERVEWTEPPDFPGAGTRHGLAAVMAHMAKARERWAEGSCAPERLVVAGDKIIAFVRVHVRRKNEIEWREGSVTDVHTFRDGKVIDVHTFGERELALSWAGVDASIGN
jgi:ketosteroid isomerase-like protein